jgi:uncharacterized protein (DUF433 family)
MLQIPDQHVPLDENEDGQLRVANSRVSLESVVAAFDSGETPEEIVQNFPTLAIEDVYAVVAYYLRNPEQVASYLQEQRRGSDALREEIQAEFPTNHLRARIFALREQRESRMG